MKKITSLFLAFIMIVSLAIPAPAATETNDYPVILVPGYSSSALQLNHPDGTSEQVWGIDMQEVLDLVKESVADIAVGAGKMTQGDYEALARVIGGGIVEICGVIALNPDGTSVNDVMPIVPNTAEACRWDNLDDAYKSEKVVMEYVQRELPDDMIYNFQCDFRMGSLENAERLHELIMDIVETTGCGKVNIIAISHGGQVTGTYLSLYGTLGYVANAVMCMPAMGGAALAYDALSNQVSFDEKTLIEFLEYGFGWETDYHWIVEAQKLGFLDDFIRELIPYVKQVLGYWVSMWDFVPLDYFDDLVATLDPVESAPLIEKTTAFHETVMKHYGENLNAAKDAGVNITILAGTGLPSVTGLQENSDAIIRTKDTTGAECAPFGQRFADGYRTLNTMCDDPTHNHLSPSMEIDASCAWLPENTWFVDGLFHGMELSDSYTMDLVMRQLVSRHPMKDVYADNAFPQFHAASSRAETVHAQFDQSAEGYLSSKDTALIIRNTTLESDVNIYGVKVQGADLQFESFDVKTVKAGNSIKLKFTGELPETSLTRVAVTVYYIACGSYTPVGSRTFDFTLMNGEPVAYDSANPYTAADFPKVSDDAPDKVKESPYAALLSAFRLLLNKIYRYILDLIKIFA